MYLSPIQGCKHFFFTLVGEKGHDDTEPPHLFILISHSASFLNLIVFGISGQPWGAEGERSCCFTQGIYSYSKSQLLFLVSQFMLPKKLSFSIQRNQHHQPLCFYATVARRRKFGQRSSQRYLLFQVKKNERRYLVRAWINLLNHGLSQLGIHVLASPYLK